MGEKGGQKSCQVTALCALVGEEDDLGHWIYWNESILIPMRAHCCTAQTEMLTI